MQVQPSGYTYFRTQSDAEWGWATLSYSNNPKQKHWIVAQTEASDNPHPFFVTGNGWVFKSGSWRRSEPTLQTDTERVTDAGAVLDSITGFWYVPSDENEVRGGTERHVGVSAEEVKSVLPEAVTADDNGLLYVDFDALTVFLIEAVKEQRQEIELLRKTLEENGLLEPEKK